MPAVVSYFLSANDDKPGLHAKRTGEPWLEASDAIRAEAGWRRADVRRRLDALGNLGDGAAPARQAKVRSFGFEQPTRKLAP